MSLHYLVKKKQVAAERLRMMFSQSVMVSVGVSKLGVTDLIFIDPRAKVNGAYYRDVFLSQQLLQMMLTCQPSSSSFNRTALLHTGRVTLRLLELATPALFTASVAAKQSRPQSS